MSYYVAVSGRKEHGKTTLAHKIRKLLRAIGIEAQLIGLSDPMYAMAKLLVDDPDLDKYKTYQIAEIPEVTIHKMVAILVGEDPLCIEEFPQGYTVRWRLTYSILDHKTLPIQEIIEKFKAALVEHCCNRSLTGTEVLQKLGTECSRDVFGEEVWNHRLQKSVRDAGNPTVVLVADCRVPVERKMMNLGIYVIADGVETTQNTAHRSEDHHRYLEQQADLIFRRNGSKYTIEFPQEE